MATTFATIEPPVTYGRARFGTRWLDTDTAVVAASGEIDAVNSDDFGDYTLRVAQRGKQLVLDLSAVGFFGLPGFSVFRAVGERTPNRWVVVSGPAVARVLRLCDRDGTLPTAGSVELAVQRLRDEARPAVELIGR